MKPSVILLFGGQSSERLVSVATAQNISRLLPDATPWFWTFAGTVEEVSRETLLKHVDAFTRPFQAVPTRTWSNLESAVSQSPSKTVFFLGLHGGAGENGTVQKLLETHQRAYTGSSSSVSREAFDKVKTKERVSRNGLRVAQAITLPHDQLTENLHSLQHFLKSNPEGILKPVADGSSSGVCFVSRDDLRGAEDFLKEHGSIDYLLEERIRGREFTVGVVDLPSGVRPLPATEICLDQGRDFDYEGKYLGKGSQEITPAKISAELYQQLAHYALTAHQTLGCEGYSRTDILVDSQGPVFLEINTLPGLTRASLIPQQLESAAISMADFLNRQIDLAQSRSHTPITKERSTL